MISSYLDTTVTEKVETVDQWGEVSSTVDTSLNARIVEGFRNVRDYRGEQVVSSAYIMLEYRNIDPATTTLNFDGRDHKILVVTHPKDFDNRFTKVYVS